MIDIHPACALCRGACCETFELEPRTWGWPTGIVLWLEWHGTPRGPATSYACACAKLRDGACSVWVDRPRPCREFPVGGPGCRTAIQDRRPDDAAAITAVLPTEEETP